MLGQKSCHTQFLYKETTVHICVVVMEKNNTLISCGYTLPKVHVVYIVYVVYFIFSHPKNKHSKYLIKIILKTLVLKISIGAMLWVNIVF